MSTHQMLMEVSDLTMRFGGLVAVNKVALQVEDRQGRDRSPS